MSSNEREIKALIKMRELPIEVICIIRDYIPYEYFVFANKMYYDTYHRFLHKRILNYESYVRNIIRHDHIMPFIKIVEFNWNKWQNMHKYIYKYMIFKNYLYFINYYCIENDATNCHTFYIKFLNEQGLCKNLHKKNIIKYIRWRD